MNKRKQPEMLAMRVATGCLEPADAYTTNRLRERGYHRGDIVLAIIKKPRNPRFNNLAHRLGDLIAKNIDEFTGMKAHAVLKRLQLEAGVACDEVLAFMELEIMGQPQRVKVNQRQARSLSFERMDEGEFKETVRALSSYVAQTYWPSLTPEQIEQMAEAMPEAA